MLDAGVPLKGSVAGVAMGLILDTKEGGGDGEPLILTDILGSEDALGDMDFKVCIVLTQVKCYLDNIFLRSCDSTCVRCLFM